MKLRGERGRSALYIYTPTYSTSVAVVESCYGRLKEDGLSLREEGQIVIGQCTYWYIGLFRYM